MLHQDHSGDVCALGADLDRATEIIANAHPAHLAEFSSLVRSASLRLEILAPSGILTEAQKSDLAVKVKRLNSLFNNASSFYNGWAALAAVSGRDALPAISVQG